MNLRDYLLTTLHMLLTNTHHITRENRIYNYCLEYKFNSKYFIVKPITSLTSDRLDILHNAQTDQEIDQRIQFIKDLHNEFNNNEYNEGAIDNMCICIRILKQQYNLKQHMSVAISLNKGSELHIFLDNSYEIPEVVYVTTRNNVRLRFNLQDRLDYETLTSKYLYVLDESFYVSQITNKLTKFQKICSYKSLTKLQSYGNWLKMIHNHMNLLTDIDQDIVDLQTNMLRNVLKFDTQNEVKFYGLHINFIYEYDVTYF